MWALRYWYYTLSMHSTHPTLYIPQGGSIHSFSLLAPPRELAVTSETMGCSLLAGHPGSSLTCLSLSADSLTLASGSDKGEVKLWDTASSQVHNGTTALD